jgi:cell division septal protein FtsQ
MNNGPGSQRALARNVSRQNAESAARNDKEKAKQEKIKEFRAWLTCAAAVLGVLVSLLSLLKAG